MDREQILADLRTWLYEQIGIRMHEGMSVTFANTVLDKIDYLEEEYE